LSPVKPAEQIAYETVVDTLLFIGVVVFTIALSASLLEVPLPLLPTSELPHK